MNYLSTSGWRTKSLNAFLKRGIQHIIKVRSTNTIFFEKLFLPLNIILLLLYFEIYWGLCHYNFMNLVLSRYSFLQYNYK